MLVPDFFSVVYFGRGTLPKKRNGESWHWTNRAGNQQENQLCLTHGCGCQNQWDAILGSVNSPPIFGYLFEWLDIGC